MAGRSPKTAVMNSSSRPRESTPACSTSKRCGSAPIPRRTSMAENTRRTSRLRVITTMLRLAWQADHAAAVLAFLLAGLGAIMQSLYGLWLKFIVDGIDTGSPFLLRFGAAGGVISIAANVVVAY